jgi:phosphoglycerate kinase
MKLSSISRFKKLKGKRVLVRVDFNIPLGPKGAIGHEEDARIRAALPTIVRLRQLGARVILVSHLGRPEGREKRYSLAPVARHLEKLLDAKVPFVADSLEDDAKVERKLASLRDGDVALLENIRFYAGEEKNSVFLARRLASLADLFVNDAFAVAHRAHASTVGVTKHLPSHAGLLLEREVRNLSKVLDKPKRPFVVLMGGAKISTKLPTIEKLLKVADRILLGGGMANNFLKAKGCGVGRSLTSPGDVRLAKRLIKEKKIALPKDLLVATGTDQDADARIAAPDDIRANEIVVDIGTTTVREWAQVIRKAKTIVWNGPVGLFEVKKFSHGSVSLGRLIAARSSGKAFGVVGGGETVQCLEMTGMAEFVDHVSTGGGAMLDLLAGKKLPAIEPLIKH